MLTILRKISLWIYYKLRSNFLTFKFVIFLKDIGVIRFIKSIIWHKSGEENDNEDTKRFIKENKERIRNMLQLLSDEKSVQVWKAVMLNRAYGKKIPERLWSDNDQYFVKNLIKIQKDEVFVDGGAYIGDTIQHLFNFTRWCVEIKKVIAFEPNPKNLAILKKYFQKNRKVIIIEKGLSDRDGFEYFKEDGSGSQVIDKRVSESGMKVAVTAIDLVYQCKDATFIKMDIEGSEMAALRGAKETIVKNKPKLAICIYHSDEDMVRIIEYIHELVPEYKLYVRHHTGGWMETVVYAVI